MYHKFVNKVNGIDAKMPKTSGLVTNTNFKLDKQGLEKEIEGPAKKLLNICGLLKITDYNTKLQLRKKRCLVLLIQVKITTFRHFHFYLLFDVSSVTTLIVKKLL